MIGHIRQPGCLPIGIDIGSSGVRLLQLRHRRGRLSLVAATKAERDGGDGQLSDTTCVALADEIQHRVNATGFIGRECVLSLDDRLLRVRAVRQVAMNDDEVSRSIAHDCRQRLGYRDEDSDIEVDWLRAGEVRQGDAVNDEIILVGTRRDPLERLILEIARRGLRPLAVEPGFVAAGRCFSRRYRRASDNDCVRVLVDIGRVSTGVTLLRGCQVVFHKPLAIGGARMTAAAAERLGIEEATVQDLRRQRKTATLAGKESPLEYRVDRAIFEAVRPLMDELAQELSLCLRYYGVTFRGSRPERCVLVGGEAGEPKLADFLRDALHLETEVGHPLSDVTAGSFSGRAERDLAGPEWAVAAG
ncbi:MAG: pilus assembly protein PilM, partial [Phycisphaerales bacterium]|nr:pilus assembly protein PilM [Phycisphaerales bacterium]